PTCVGFTRTGDGTPPGGAVHPHVRGVHPKGPPNRSEKSGPSPRAWGSQRQPRRIRPGHRSIPTCVGFTFPHTGLHRPDSVHPHVRGVHVARLTGRLPSVGPSPRAWGSPPGFRTDLHPRRSIPTCVG